MNRDLLKKWFDWKKNTVPITPIASGEGDKKSEGNLTNLDADMARGPQMSQEENWDLEQSKEIFWQSIDILKNELSATQKRLLNLKAAGTKNREILAALKITNKSMKDSLDYIKSRLNIIIMEEALKRGIDMNYQNMVVSLGGNE